jgi:hypothetical protein
MDYDTLVSTVKSYCENDFPNTVGDNALTSTEQVNTFIKQAEQRIYNAVQSLDFRKVSTIVCTPADPYIDLPADWKATFSLAVVNSSGEYSFLRNKDIEFIREAYPDPTDDDGIPAFYAIYSNDEIILGPTPDDDYTIYINYFYYPETIVTADTTWLGDNFDSVLLYGALLEAATFMKAEQDVMANYKARYDEALAMLKQYSEGKNRQDQYRTEQVRYPVR